MNPSATPDPGAKKSDRSPQSPKTPDGGPSLLPLGKYKILRELGRGAMGIVYEALDTDLERRVALKMLRVDPCATPGEVQEDEERFLREARVGAGLRKHPNLVGVYEAGIIDDRRYIAMELVEGRPMSLWRISASPTRKEQIILLRDVALAVHHAHDQGVIHRDLKPENILVDPQGRPHVTDLGVSKRTGSDGNLSLSLAGTIVGTPSYMSPEQAQGEKNIDRRTDIYSLGVILYEILTGRPPFGGPSAVQILMKVVQNPVPPPSSITKVDVGLENICLKALAKLPRARYGTARGFADDLSRWLAGEEVHVVAAEPRAATPSRKSKVWIGIGIGAAILLVVGLVAGIPSDAERKIRAQIEAARRFHEEGHFAEAWSTYTKVLNRDPKNKEAQAGRQEAKRKLDDEANTERIRQAEAATQVAREQGAQKIREAEERLAVLEKARAEEKEKARKEGEEKARTEAASAEAERKRLEELEKERAAAEAAKAVVEPPKPAPRPAFVSLPGVRVLSAHVGRVGVLAFDGQASHLISGGADQTLRIWDLRSEGSPKILKGDMGEVKAIAAEPAGRRLASTSADGTIRLWDLDRAEETASLLGHPDGTESIAWSPDGKWLASAGRDRKIKVWDLASGKEVRSLVGHVLAVTAVAFGPEGTLLASGSDDSMVRVWDPTTGRSIRTFTGGFGSVTSVALSPRGYWATSAGKGPAVKLWSVPTGKEVRTLGGHTDTVTAVSFSPSGTVLASAGADRTVRLWESSSGRELRVLKGHTGRISALCFSTDGRTLASAGDGGEIRLWTVADVINSVDPFLTPKEMLVSLPDGIKQGVLEKQIRLTFKSDYAKRTPADQRSLAEKLWRRGLEDWGDLAERFVLLREARDLATAAGDVPLAMASVENLGEVFAIDAPTLRVEVLGKVSIGDRTSDEARSIGEFYLRLIRETIEAGDYERAKSFVPRAELSAKVAKDASLAVQVQAGQKEASDLQAEDQRYKSAERMITTHPDDPTANLTAGRFLCLVKGDWGKGLTLLAKGSDEELSALARKDLGQPADPTECVALCNAWLDRADKEPDWGRRRAIARAAFWYWKAAPELGEATREKIEARLKIDRQETPTAPAVVATAAPQEAEKSGKEKAQAAPSDRIGKEKAPTVAKKAVAEVQGRKGAAILMTSSLKGRELLTATFEGVLRKDFAAVKGSAEMYSKGIVYLVRTGDRFDSPSDLKGREGALASAFKNPALMLAEFARLAPGATFSDDETLEGHDCRIVAVPVDEQALKQELKDMATRLSGAIKDASGLIDPGNIGNYFDEKNSIAGFRAWIGKGDFLVHKLEWSFKPRFKKESLPPGLKLPEVEAQTSVLLSKWDADVPFEIPKAIKAKWNLK
jgi:hypothetical protein